MSIVLEKASKEVSKSANLRKDKTIAVNVEAEAKERRREHRENLAYRHQQEQIELFMEQDRARGVAAEVSGVGTTIDAVAAAEVPGSDDVIDISEGSEASSEGSESLRGRDAVISPRGEDLPCPEGSGRSTGKPAARGGGRRVGSKVGSADLGDGAKRSKKKNIDQGRKKGPAEPLQPVIPYEMKEDGTSRALPPLNAGILRPNSSGAYRWKNVEASWCGVQDLTSVLARAGAPAGLVFIPPRADMRPWSPPFGYACVRIMVRGRSFVMVSSAEVGDCLLSSEGYADVPTDGENGSSDGVAAC